MKLKPRLIFKHMLLWFDLIINTPGDWINIFWLILNDFLFLLYFLFRLQASDIILFYWISLFMCWSNTKQLQNKHFYLRIEQLTDSGFFTKSFVLPHCHWSGSILTQDMRCFIPCLSSPRQHGHVSGVRIAYLLQYNQLF